MEEKRKNKINEALIGLSQQEAYDLICEYKERFEEIYPMIDKNKFNKSQIIKNLN